MSKLTKDIIGKFFKEWPENNKDDQIFISENDLVLSFAFFMKQEFKEAKIKFEYPFQINFNEIFPTEKKINSQTSYIDLIIKLDNEIIGFEFKYFTSKLQVENPNFKFELKDQVARDILRFGYRKDLHRLEFLKENKIEGNVRINTGFAILLTNDSLLYDTIQNPSALDTEYRFSNDMPIKGNINGWLKKEINPKWIQQKQFNIDLPLNAPIYPVFWNDYIEYNTNEKNKLFKYCIIEV